jgi:hypothetical protein
MTGINQVQLTKTSEFAIYARTLQSAKTRHIAVVIDIEVLKRYFTFGRVRSASFERQ